MTRPRRGLLPLLVAGLLFGCATQEPVRPARDLAVPPSSADPYAAYYKELKQRINEKWVYPREAVEQGQSGTGSVRFEVRKNGSLRTVEIVKSSGVRLLDSYIENAILLAAPFPPFPATIGEDVQPITLDSRYTAPRRGSVSP